MRALLGGQQLATLAEAVAGTVQAVADTSAPEAAAYGGYSGYVVLLSLVGMLIRGVIVTKRHHGEVVKGLESVIKRQDRIIERQAGLLSSQNRSMHEQAVPALRDAATSAVAAREDLLSRLEAFIDQSRDGP